MAQLVNQFNPNEHSGMRDFSVIPAGQYTARVTASEMKQTKDGEGKFLMLTFTINTPSHKDKDLIVRLNLVNKNPVAVEIANGELKTICEAIGITSAITDSDILHGKNMLITVAIQPPRNGYGESNNISMYTAIAGSEAHTTEVAENAPAAAPAWANK